MTKGYIGMGILDAYVQYNNGNIGLQALIVMMNCSILPLELVTGATLTQSLHSVQN